MTNEPVPMILHCPMCGVQHIDQANPATGWTDPPHRSHVCQTCGVQWRPSDSYTRGVAVLGTRGEKDTWTATRVLNMLTPDEREFGEKFMILEDTPYVKYQNELLARMVEPIRKAFDQMTQDAKQALLPFHTDREPVARMPMPNGGELSIFTGQPPSPHDHRHVVPWVGHTTGSWDDLPVADMSVRPANRDFRTPLNVTVDKPSATWGVLPTVEEVQKFADALGAKAFDPALKHSPLNVVPDYTDDELAEFAFAPHPFIVTVRFRAAGVQTHTMPAASRGDAFDLAAKFLGQQNVRSVMIRPTGAA